MEILKEMNFNFKTLENSIKTIGVLAMIIACIILLIDNAINHIW